MWLPALKSLFFTSNRYQAGSQDPAEDGSTDQRIDMYLLRTDTGELQQARQASLALHPTSTAPLGLQGTGSFCAFAAPPALLLASCLGHQAAAVVACHQKRVWPDGNVTTLNTVQVLPAEPGLVLMPNGATNWSPTQVLLTAQARCQLLISMRLLPALALRSGNLSFMGCCQDALARRCCEGRSACR